LKGTPREIKIKYIADTELGGLKSSEMNEQTRARIKAHRTNKQVDANEGIGTTPRQITDLLGSLADLTSGSGDKGTPVVYIQGYFDNYASE
ncbi:coenzyme F420-0:L-glutamate ligase, partial [Salmonella enterica]|uniref:coenzyme F420-0:L-glutamate ligase n=1 Tax=Salmonella enterica TaxID=28901 RepID=UPI000CAEA913